MASDELVTDDSCPDARRQAFLIDDPSFMRDVIQKAVQRVLEGEMAEFLQAAPYERTNVRRGYRSGHRPRKLKTRVGAMSLEVPTERAGKFRTRVFANYQRSEQAFVLALQEMYLQGVSTRKVREITEELSGVSFSASTVSRLTKRLDEDLTRWRSRRLAESYPVSYTHLTLPTN